MKPGRPKTKDLLTYSVHNLDVWGNKKDGFEVNDILPSSGKISLKKTFTDKQLISKLKKEGYIKKGIHTKSVQIDGGEDDLYISDARTSEPVFTLRRK